MVRWLLLLLLLLLLLPQKNNKNLLRSGYQHYFCGSTSHRG